MKTLIVFSSSHGTSAKAALFLRNHIAGDVVVLNLKRTKLFSDVDIFDAVIIGGSIHTGSIQREIKKFMKENQDVLKRKTLGLFLCCIREGDIALKQFDNAYNKELRESAAATGIFGGEYLISKMNLFERLFVKSVSGVVTDTSNLDIESMNHFAETFNQQNKSMSVF
ncbi:flavodoxin domain-containing protein [Mesobacillus harenae]|uniref:flavodoxin domain-containing protein n=1 Tax=Mesobacillus harenae TaxID=2213203 RepID=UPI0015801F6E|nr:flavodoxin domain-containing protein [Mesobacillus harenae]